MNCAVHSSCLVRLRSAVLVHQGRGFARVFHLSKPSSPSVRDATAPAIVPLFVRRAVAGVKPPHALSGAPLDESAGGISEFVAELL